MNEQEPMTQRTLGVLGGMGPAATAHFFKRVVELTPATRDQEHLRIVVYNDPQVPDRTAAILGEGTDPLPALLAGIEALEKAGAEVLAMPCNSAHYWLEEMRRASKVPILNIVSEVAAALAGLRPKPEKVGLLATTGTVQSGIYERPLSQLGCRLLLPEEWEQGDLMAVIRRIKSSEADADSVRVFAQKLIDRGAQAIILGCTELSLVADRLHLPVPVVDSVEVLAQAAVDAALGRRERY